MAEDKVYIMGHKNPDTDSCCAAVSYAEFKKITTGKDYYYPAAAGYSNSKTDAIFKKFGIPFPEIVKDVSPTIKDVMDFEPPSVKVGQVLLEALKLMQSKHLYRIPVVTDSNKYKGMISFFDLSERFFKSDSPSDEKGASLLSREINTTINLAARTLEAEKLSLHKPDEPETLLVYVAAISLSGLREHVNEHGADRLVIVVGDREDIQFMAVELNIRLLIVIGKAPVSKILIDIAKRNGTSILRTRFDSATSIRHLKFSAPVENVLQAQTTTFSAKDRISDVKQKVINTNEDDFAVINSKGELKGSFQKIHLDRVPSTKLIMVDHNNYDQAVDGAPDVPLLEILDHHHLDMPVTTNPVTVLNDIVGSTCTLVSEKYRNNGIKPRPEIAGLLMGGILSDTVIFKSPTCTQRDKNIIEWLEGISGVTVKEFEQEIFKAGSQIALMSPKKVLNVDKKSYNASGYNISIAQIEEFSFKEYNERYDKLLGTLKEIKVNEKLDLFGLLVTNVETQDSILLVDGLQEIIDALPYKRLTDNSFSLPGVLSRKKQLVPQLMNTLAGVK